MQAAVTPPSEPAVETLWGELKAATRREHAMMEEVFPFPRDHATHRRNIARFFGFVEPWETRLTQQLGEGHPWLAGRLKTNWLKEDLAALGYAAPDVEQLPRCTSLPRIATPEQAWGSMYVFEGSTLGGQLISRHLENVLGLTGGRGYRYFRSYGDQVPQRWQAFRASGRAVAQAAPAVSASAQETFRCLREWLQSAS